MAELETKYPEARYLGQDITCYPSSNATDDGKLQLEFNMARLVTRVSSKNFCIVNPSFQLAQVADAVTGNPKIRVGIGQASINGMDLIMSNAIEIEPPQTKGTFYLAFKLARNEGNNVLGDLIVDVVKTFEGLVLSYYDEKPDPMDPDMLFLGQVDWDGTKFDNIIEDEDKYGRIWAEDILAKFEDPKHPDVRRLNLQEFIYNLPEWYFSKEGDTIYGPLIIADNRTNKNPGVIINVDEKGSYVSIKDPAVDNNELQFYGDLNRDGVIDSKDVTILKNFLDGKATLTDAQKALADVNHDGVVDEKDLLYIQRYIDKEGNCGDTGNIYYIDNTNKGINANVSNGTSKVEIGKGTIYESETDDILHIHNGGDICLDAEGKLSLQGDNEIIISTENSSSPVLKLDNTSFSITDPTASDLSFKVTTTDANTMQQTLGKAIWQYNKTTKNVSLLQDNVNYLEITPNSIFKQNARIINTLYLGADDALPQTTLARTSWWLRENVTNGKTINFTPSTILMTNPAGNGASTLKLKNSDDTKHTILYDNGKIELKNNTDELTSIKFTDGNSSYDVSIQKSKGEQKLNISGALNVTSNIYSAGTVTGKTGVVTQSGVITFVRGTNNATITKDNNSTALRTNGNLYVGANGTSSLFAGATTLKGETKIGSSGQCVIKTDGSISTSGTITGSKVYNAVYNGFGEIFRKDKNETIEYGDVVCIREDGLAHKVQTDSDINTIIGICSNTIGVQMGGKDIPEDEQLEVEMVGQIWVKTNDIDLKPGQLVKAISDGTVTYTDNKDEKFGITLTEVIDGKVRIVYNG